MWIWESSVYRRAGWKYNNRRNNTTWNRNDNNAKDNKRERIDINSLASDSKKNAKIGAESMAAVHAQASEEIKAAKEKIDETKAAQEAKEPNNQTLISDFWPGIVQSLLNNQTMNKWLI